MKRSVVFLGSLIVLTLAVIFGRDYVKGKVNSSAESPRVTQQQSKQEVRQTNFQPQQPPPHMSYWVMFQHIRLLNQQAEEAEQKGEDGSKYRKRYQTFARLTDPQAQALNEIALDTHRQVNEMDVRAKAIVAEIRARTPDGRLLPGEKPPEFPAELQRMQTQRNQLIESGYNRLRKAFGEAAFTSFENFVKKQIEPNFTVIDPKSVRPAGNQPQLLDKARRVQ